MVGDGIGGLSRTLLFHGGLFHSLRYRVVGLFGARLVDRLLKGRFLDRLVEMALLEVVTVS